MIFSNETCSFRYSKFHISEFLESTLVQHTNENKNSNNNTDFNEVLKINEISTNKSNLKNNFDGNFETTSSGQREINLLKSNSFTVYYIGIAIISLLVLILMIQRITGSKKICEDALNCDASLPFEEFKELIMISNEMKRTQKMPKEIFKTNENKTLKELNITTKITPSTKTQNKQNAKHSIVKLIFLCVSLIILFTFLISIIVWLILKIAIIFYESYKLHKEIEKNESKSLEYRKMLTIMCRELIDPSDDL